MKLVQKIIFCLVFGSSSFALAEGNYQMKVDNYDKLSLFFTNGHNSLHRTGDLVTYGNDAYLIKAPMSDAGWNNFVNAGFPYPGPGAMRSHKSYTRISDGQCVTFAEWVTNACGLRTVDYLPGAKVVEMSDPSLLLGRAIATFECNSGRKFCQGENRKWGHIVIVVNAERGYDNKIRSAWVIDSNTLPSPSVNEGGVISKQKMLYSELKKYHIVTHNRNPQEIRCTK